ncbi:hypothetical protein MTP04_18500 [Lysinibacillus sp. PLM2]|nr:hypothetical protein MTP04_18500 [Lysinibacillus sp. PLM2]
MKKLSVLSAIFLAFTLVFSSVGSVLLLGDDHVAEAKSYKSGKKGFSSTPGSNNSNIQSKDTNTNSSTVNKNNTNTTNNGGGFTTGGLMRGLFVGGLAGLLFGSLFSDMGLIGNLLGFAINAIAIVVIIALCVKIYQMITRKKDKEVTEGWKK